MRQTNNTQPTDETLFRAYVLPFAIFMGCTLVLQFVMPFFAWEHPSAAWWQRHPEHLIYPIQALVCFAWILFYRRAITWDWSLRASLWGMALGVLGIVCWLLPTHLADLWQTDGTEWFRFLGIAPRTEGFNPADVAAQDSFAWWGVLGFRFFRAVIVVALVEELFWRGFLMRYCVDSHALWRVALGTHSWTGYFVTTTAFVIIHSPVDYLAAFVYGSLAYFLMVWQRNLTATFVMHATANLIMGIYAMQYQKFGLW